MYHSILIKYGEIGIKGKNRYVFEDALAKRIKQALAPLQDGYKIEKERGRIYIECPDGWDYDAAMERLSKVFGIVGICPVVIKEKKDPEALREDIVDYVNEIHPDYSGTFKMHIRRVDKKFPQDSMEIAAALGEVIIENFPEFKVDVHDPELMIHVEIRDRVYIYSKEIPGPGGMPVGTNGRAMLLLSGGIDSPVAGYMIGKRGVLINAVYFHAPPYTSERAKQKVIDLARIVASYTGPIWLRVVNFTDIQLYIYEECPHEELTIIMRRYMMRIAEYFAKDLKCHGLITGESIGQVASQTMQSLIATNEVCTLPVHRPLVGLDKNEIIKISREIGTYETSILPYEDCCTIFVAKHPVTKPNVNIIRNSEKKLAEKIDELVKTAIESSELIKISG